MKQQLGDVKSSEQQFLTLVEEVNTKMSSAPHVENPKSEVKKKMTDLRNEIAKLTTERYHYQFDAQSFRNEFSKILTLKSRSNGIAFNGIPPSTDTNSLPLQPIVFFIPFIGFNRILDLKEFEIYLSPKFR